MMAGLKLTTNSLILEKVSTIRFMANYGRPMFGSRLRFTNDVREIIDFAAHKLLGALPWEGITTNAQRLACVARRLPVDFCSATSAAYKILWNTFKSSQYPLPTTSRMSQHLDSSFPWSSLPMQMKLGSLLYPQPRLSKAKAVQRLDSCSIVKIGTLAYPSPDVWLDPNDHERAYLVMEYLTGEDLDLAWPKMKKAQRKSVLLQLKSAMTELRALTQAVPGRVESCSGGPCMDDRHTPSGNFIFGPFASVSEFHDFLFSTMKKHVSEAAYERCRSRYRPFDGHRDLQPKNILVEAATGRLVAILDWEMAGWWPAYWEYRKAFNGWDECGLRKGVGEVLTAFQEEYLVEQEHEFY